METIEKFQKDFQKGVEDATAVVDQNFKLAAKTASSGVAYAASLYQDAFKSATKVAGQGQVLFDSSLKQYQELEGVAITSTTGGLQWAAANPYIAYSAAGTGAMLLMPYTRRLLYRMTLGQLRSPSSVVESCGARVKGISSKMENYTTMGEQLQARMAKGEEEYKSGLAKLRSARVEMQRLSASLSKGERSAAGVVKELRTMPPKVENVLQLRGEAANLASALKQQRAKIDKSVKIIANMDI